MPHIESNAVLGPALAHLSVNVVLSVSITDHMTRFTDLFTGTLVIIYIQGNRMRLNVPGIRP